MNLQFLDKLDDIRLIGHPYAPMGMGEHIRSVLRAFRAVGASPKVLDVYRLNPRTDPSFAAELDGCLVDQLGSGLNLFLLNGDELEQAIPHLGGLPDQATNVIYPAWELPRYPEVWARKLELFDEVWAPSRFIADAISPAVQCPVVHMPLACEVKLRSFYGRRHFGIPESAFAFLFFFDFTSFVARKNPFAVIEAFSRAYARCEDADACLVLKLNRGTLALDAYEQFLEEMSRRRERVILLDTTLSDDEIKSLVRCCDSFVSLHRSEGFGRGMSEAMCLGKPVIATGWSGNLDFMNNDVGCLVDHQLIPVKDGEYPHWEEQVWADPDVGSAADWMVRLMRERRWVADLGQRASRHLRTYFSYRARGLAYASRAVELMEQQSLAT